MNIKLKLFVANYRRSLNYKLENNVIQYPLSFFKNIVIVTTLILTVFTFVGILFDVILNLNYVMYALILSILGSFLISTISNEQSIKQKSKLDYSITPAILIHTSLLFLTLTGVSLSMGGLFLQDVFFSIDIILLLILFGINLSFLSLFYIMDPSRSTPFVWPTFVYVFYSVICIILFMNVYPFENHTISIGLASISTAALFMLKLAIPKSISRSMELMQLTKFIALITLGLVILANFSVSNSSFDLLIPKIKPEKIFQLNDGARHHFIQEVSTDFIIITTFTEDNVVYYVYDNDGNELHIFEAQNEQHNERHRIMVINDEIHYFVYVPQLNETEEETSFKYYQATVYEFDTDAFVMKSSTIIKYIFTEQKPLFLDNEYFIYHEGEWINIDDKTPEISSENQILSDGVATYLAQIDNEIVVLDKIGENHVGIYGDDTLQVVPVSEYLNGDREGTLFSNYSYFRRGQSIRSYYENGMLYEVDVNQINIYREKDNFRHVFEVSNLRSFGVDNTHDNYFYHENEDGDLVRYDMTDMYYYVVNKETNSFDTSLKWMMICVMFLLPIYTSLNRKDVKQ